MNIVFYGKFGREAVIGALVRRPSVLIQCAETVEQLRDVIDTAEMLVMVGPMYSEQVAAILKNAPRLKWIQTLSAGYENLIRFGTPSGVTVSNAGDSWSSSVAEHAMALMLAWAKRIPDASQQQSQQLWDRQLMSRMVSLEGRTLLILGLGSIGKEIALRARAFGMRVTAVTRTQRPSELADRVFASSEIDEALGQADVVVVAVPSQVETVHLINDRTLAACKPGSMLINISRGNVVDQGALVRALESGHLGGAGLDVTDPEPLPAEAALWRAPNVIITPHVAGGGEAVTRKLADLVSANLDLYITGQDLRCVVIKP